MALKISLAVRPITLICVLDAAERFAEDLFDHLPDETSLIYVRCKSYKGMYTKGTVEVHPVSKVQLTDMPAGDVIIVDTIVDTGATVSKLRDWVENHFDYPKVAALLVREGSEGLADYYGKVIPEDQFVIGYGLDYKGKYRNLDDIYVVRES